MTEGDFHQIFLSPVRTGCREMRRFGKIKKTFFKKERKKRKISDGFAQGGSWYSDGPDGGKMVCLDDFYDGEKGHFDKDCMVTTFELIANCTFSWEANMCVSFRFIPSGWERTRNSKRICSLWVRLLPQTVIVNSLFTLEIATQAARFSPTIETASRAWRTSRLPP